MDVQQIEVKLPVADGAEADLEALIPVLHRWIQQNRLGDDIVLIDVADYRHVHEGPALMLIADGAQWRLDFGGGELGLVFARKRDRPGPARAKLREAFRRAAQAADALENEPSLAGKLRFRGDRARVTVMSRLVAPNDDASWAAFEPELHAVAGELYGGDSIEIERVGSEREPLGATLTASSEVAPRELLARLS